VLSKNRHQSGESLDSLVELPASKWPTPVELPTKHFTVLLLYYISHEQKDFVVFILRVRNVLKFDAATYSMERD
jgi:hypothetical protein